MRQNVNKHTKSTKILIIRMCCMAFAFFVYLFRFFSVVLLFIDTDNVYFSFRCTCVIKVNIINKKCKTYKRNRLQNKMMEFLLIVVYSVYRIGNINDFWLNFIRPPVIKIIFILIECHLFAFISIVTKK